MIPNLVIKNLNKGFESSGESFEVFRDLSFEIDPNSATALIGESGSGKTTLIHLIAGLEPPDSGTIEVEGFDIWKYSEEKRAGFRLHNVSIIFQQYNLIPSLNVLNNIKFHSQLIKKFDQEFQDELVELLGLKKLLKKYPEEISGGQQQRVAIARAILTKPKILLADEPTGNLDEDNSLKVANAFELLLSRYNSTVFIATHSKDLANKMNAKLLIKNKKIKKI